MDLDDTKPAYFSVVVYIFAGVCSLIAVLPIEAYEFYMFLRWLLFLAFSSSILVFFYLKDDNSFYVLVLGLLGLLLWQPFDIVEHTRGTWAVFNILASIYFFTISKYLFDEAKLDTKSQEIKGKIHEQQLLVKRQETQLISRQNSNQSEYDYKKKYHPFDSNYFTESEIKEHRQEEFLNMIMGFLVLIIIVSLFVAIPVVLRRGLDNIF